MIEPSSQSRNKRADIMAQDYEWKKKLLEKEEMAGHDKRMLNI